MDDADRPERRRKVRSLRFAIAAMAVFIGLAVSPAPSVAWADPASSGASSSDSSQTGPADRADSDEPADQGADTEDSSPPDTADRQDEPGTTEDGTDPEADAEISDAEISEAEVDGAEISEAEDAPEAVDPLAEVADSEEPEPALEDQPASPAGTETGAPDADTTSDTPEVSVPESDSTSTPDDVAAETEPSADAPAASPTVADVDLTTLDEDSAAATTEAAITAPVEVRTIETPGTTADIGTTALVTNPATVDTLAPTPPQPLSPLAKLLELPGRLINAVLQVFDITTSANGPQTPISLAPINDLLFAAFREFERLLGLDQEQSPPPPVPTLTYTGPTTTPTPTVEQFLNASAAGYGLGTTPGGMVPFTVNGFQMSSTNIFNGHVGKAWVTPEGQVIIAYQGTTGGTHLLFNPLIAITQVLTDIQVIFTPTTPWAFHDALRFARRVQAEAAEQGYGTDDIFVTGHSLGGWQAQYVAQQTGLAGIGFETPGINTVVPGNGADSMFVNIETYGDAAPYMSTDLPGLQPYMPPYVPGGGSKPHYGPIVMIGDPANMTPLRNASALWGKGIIGNVLFMIDFLGNFFQYHLPGVQAHYLGVTPDPGVVAWMGRPSGPAVNTGYGDLTIPQLLQAASDTGNLFQP